MDERYKKAFASYKKRIGREPHYTCCHCDDSSNCKFAWDDICQHGFCYYEEDLKKDHEDPVFRMVREYIEDHKAKNKNADD